MSENKLDARHMDRHLEIHRGFLDDVSSIYSGIPSDNPDQAETFLEFLINWLAFHILAQDQDMARQIKAIQSGMSPGEAYEKLEQEKVSSTEPLIKALNGLFEQVSMENKALKQLNESL